MSMKHYTQNVRCETSMSVAIVSWSVRMCTCMSQAQGAGPTDILRVGVLNYGPCYHMEVLKKNVI